MRHWFIYSLPLVLFLLVAVFLWRGLSLNPKVVPSPLIGKPMPTFHLPTLESGEFLTDQDFLGEPILLNVWASWCNACRAEHAMLLNIADEIPIIGWNYKDDVQAAQQQLQRLGNPYQVVLVDNAGKAAIDWGIYGTPETFLIDAEGIIHYKHTGPITKKVWQQQFLPLIEQLRAKT